MSEATIGGGVSFHDGKRRFRCSKGHEWDEELFGTGLWRSITFEDSPPICRRCIVDFLVANMGIVEEVKSS